MLLDNLVLDCFFTSVDLGQTFLQQFVLTVTNPVALLCLAAAEHCGEYQCPLSTMFHNGGDLEAHRALLLQTMYFRPVAITWGTLKYANASSVQEAMHF